eukprot:m.107565 g.107565  ORF g.107565 m.107565 type:complete len:71 (+) comp9176_c2_seq4:241-453(+)
MEFSCPPWFFSLSFLGVAAVVVALVDWFAGKKVAIRAELKKKKKHDKRLLPSLMFLNTAPTVLLPLSHLY